MDDNVTRHVPEELLNADWNGCVLHYLGLDHIGHKAGPNRYIPSLTFYPLSFPRAILYCRGYMLIRIKSRS